MNRILQLSADEQNSISSGIIKYVLVNRAKNNTGMNIDDSVYITEYLDSRINSWGIYLILLKGEEVLYNNFSFELSDIGSIDYAGKATWRVQEIEDQPYLVILSRIPLSDENLWNIYVRNISDISVSYTHLLLRLEGRRLRRSGISGGHTGCGCLPA